MSDNPLAEATVERVAPPAVLVVFGASGDLTARKLMPAIENLAVSRLLPRGFSVVGVARTEMDDKGFREHDAGRGHRRRAAAGRRPSTSGIPSPGGFRYVAGDYADPETSRG